jgi:hypothetical protein
MKTLKAKKLTIKKDTLRTLTQTDLQRVAGGWINSTGSDYCSSVGYNKCGNQNTLLP